MLCPPRKRSRRPQYSILAGLLRTSLEVLGVLHLPRKKGLTCFKCCTCHANAAGVHSTQSSPDFCGPLWRCSARAALAAQNETEVLQVLPPATQNETVLQVLRLPRKMRLTCFKCCACYANAAGVHSNYSILAGLPQTSLEVLHVLHLPQKMRLRCSKCCACHAPASTVIPQSSPDFRGRLWRCSRCCTCHAK